LSFERDLIFQHSGSAVVLGSGRGEAGSNCLETCLSIPRVQGCANERIPGWAVIVRLFRLSELKRSQCRIKRDLVR
jgi:hypothetical protein